MTEPITCRCGNVWSSDAGPPLRCVSCGRKWPVADGSPEPDGADSPVFQAIDQFAEVLSTWTEVAKLHQATQDVYPALVAATLDEKNTTLRRFRSGLEDGGLFECGFVSLTCGTLVELGADADICGPVLLKRMEEHLGIMTEYWKRVEAATGQAPNPHNAKQLGEQYLGGVPEEKRAEEAAASGSFYVNSFLTLGVITHLSRSKALRATARQRPQLLAQARSADLSFNEFSHFEILLRVLDDAPLVVLHPRQRRGYRLRMSGVTDLSQLDTLLAARLIGDPAAGWLTGTPPSPEVAASAGSGPVREDLKGNAAFNLWAWGGLKPDGQLPAYQNPEYGLPWGVLPVQLPAFDGVPVLLLGARMPAVEWPATRRHGYLDGELTVEAVLTEAEVNDWLARIATAPRTGDAGRAQPQG